MDPALHALIGLAILSTAVVYGTDIFCATVLCPALVRVDDGALTTVMGRVHQYGDRRMPIPGVTGLVAAIAATILAGSTDRLWPATLTAAALLAMIAWLIVYTRVSAPINKQLSTAATQHRTPSDARSLQHAWDSVIVPRALLQSTALAALCIAQAT